MNTKMLLLLSKIIKGLLFDSNEFKNYEIKIRRDCLTISNKTKNNIQKNFKPFTSNLSI